MTQEQAKSQSHRVTNYSISFGRYVNGKPVAALPVAGFLSSDSDLEAVRPAAVMRRIYAEKTVRHKTARSERQKIKISVFSLRLMYSRREA